MRQTNSDVAYSDWRRLVQNANDFEPGDVIARTMESVHADPQIAAFSDFWCPPAALLYHRRIVEKIDGWNETLPVIQDARFLLDAALHGGRFVHAPGVGAFYRVHNGQSLSRRSNRAFVRDCLENALQVESWWRQQGALTNEQLVAVLNALAYVARASFEVDRETFYRAVQAGNRLKPHWSPQRPHSLRILSRILGYPQAESCALMYRRLKGALSGTQT